MPVKLIGEGEYNLDSVTEIEITDSFLGLDEDVKGCNKDEGLNDCNSKYFVAKVLDHCGCMPLNLMTPEQVRLKLL